MGQCGRSRGEVGNWDAAARVVAVVRMSLGARFLRSGTQVVVLGLALHHFSISFGSRTRGCKGRTDGHSDARRVASMCRAVAVTHHHHLSTQTFLHSPLHWFMFIDRSPFHVCASCSYSPSNAIYRFHRHSSSVSFASNHPFIIRHTFPHLVSLISISSRSRRRYRACTIPSYFIPQ